MTLVGFIVWPALLIVVHLLNLTQLLLIQFPFQFISHIQPGNKCLERGGPFKKTWKLANLDTCGLEIR